MLFLALPISTRWSRLVFFSSYAGLRSAFLSSRRGYASSLLIARWIRFSCLAYRWLAHRWLAYYRWFAYYRWSPLVSLRPLVTIFCFFSRWLAHRWFSLALVTIPLAQPTAGYATLAELAYYRWFLLVSLPLKIAPPFTAGDVTFLAG